MSNYSPYFTILKLSQSSVITIIIIWTTVCLLPLKVVKVELNLKVHKKYSKLKFVKQKTRNRQCHLNSWVNSNGGRVKVKVQRFVCRHLARQDEQSRYFKVCFRRTMTGRPWGTFKRLSVREGLGVVVLGDCLSGEGPLDDTPTFQWTNTVDLNPHCDTGPKDTTKTGLPSSNILHSNGLWCSTIILCLTSTSSALKTGKKWHTNFLKM